MASPTRGPVQINGGGRVAEQRTPFLQLRQRPLERGGDTRPCSNRGIDIRRHAEKAMDHARAILIFHQGSRLAKRLGVASTFVVQDVALGSDDDGWGSATEAACLER